MFLFGCSRSHSRKTIHRHRGHSTQASMWMYQLEKEENSARQSADLRAHLGKYVGFFFVARIAAIVLN